MLPYLYLCLLLSPGFPGPECRADYRIEVELKPDSNLVTGSCEIEFTNGMEFSVDTLWLHLYPNAYSDHTTAFGRDLEAVGRYSFRASPREDRGWIELREWYLDGVPVNVSVDGTLGYLPLDSPLEEGGTAVLSGEFHLHVPQFWSRLGHLGATYQITQWYPKMCVLDRDGWHRDRYRRRGEFYSDYGNYDVVLRIPSEFLTAATGRIAHTSFEEDSLVRVEEWEASNVHDFVWSASPLYTIRDHTYTYPEILGGDSVRVHLVLLSDSEDHWDEVPAIVDSTLLYYGEWYVPYPYDDLWIVEPAVLSAGGMEYPQFVFSGGDFPVLRVLEIITSHEVGHQWFYGMLGNDEVNEAWLDEGMNTFSELRYMERKYGFSGNLSSTPRWLLELSDQETSLMTYVTGTFAQGKVPVLSNATEAGDGSHPTGFTYYSKPAFFMRMLRRQLGEEAFDQVMSIYFQRFMYHHPHTEDFQAIVEDVSGQSWDMEFDYWLRGNGSSDIRIAHLETGSDSTSVLIDGDIPHPLEIDVLLAAGEDTLITSASMIPGSLVELRIPGQWDRATVDPWLLLPDSAPWNNSFPPLGQLKPMIFPIPRPEYYSLWILPFPSYAAGSWRADVLFMSSAIPSYTGGPYTWSGQLSVPFSEDGHSAWGASFHAPISREYRRGTYVSTGITRGFGIGRAYFGLDHIRSGRVPSRPRLELSVGLDLISVEETDVYGSENIEEGKGVEISSAASIQDENYRLSWSGELSGVYSPGWNLDEYARIDLSMDFTERISGNFLARTRIYAGRILGGAPVQSLLRPGGALFARGVMNAFIPPDGSLSPLDHYFVRFGPALPGYSGSNMLGRASLTVEQRLPLPMPFFCAEVFAGGGWIADGFSDFSRETFLANAGISLRLAFLELLLPLWISDPLDGESNWEFRWRFGLSPAGFPDLY